MKPEQAQRAKDMQEKFSSHCKVFKKIYKPTNNNLRTSSNTRNKNVDTTPRYKNDNQSGQFGNQRAENVAGARETVETSITLGESNSIQDSCLVALQNKQTEFERYKAFNDRTVYYDKLEHMEILIKTCLMPLVLKTQNDSFAFVHKLKQEMHADLKYVESLEDEIDELESDKA
ncbi:hypothetical protein Tco_0704260 [Tanacetum coccineum]|uniref:Gag-Pol polyprotein n=1 Tax=Tanacetum coccineum TaxID=301880 RepID=A0ABQ4Y1M4_9ASTR